MWMTRKPGWKEFHATNSPKFKNPNKQKNHPKFKFLGIFLELK